MDKLLKNELCVTLQAVLEHGLIFHKDLPLAKQTTVWKIIEATIDHGKEEEKKTSIFIFLRHFILLGQSLQVFNEARQFAQNASPYWVYKFQAFTFFLLK